MKKACCCEGLRKITPVSIDNRPGLSKISYRVGTYASFLKTMEAGISLEKLEVPSYAPGPVDQGELKNDIIAPLKGLTVRFESDPSIAFLDAWATVADVLTFYQERIANEGYLRTATERRSILELARLVGYKLKPGVSSSVFLAYTLEDGYRNITIPSGSRSQTVPGQGELPQSFETSYDLKASCEWNNLKPRTSLPQDITYDKIKKDDTVKDDLVHLVDKSFNRLYLKGAIYDLLPNSPLLFSFLKSAAPLRYQYRTPRIEKVEVQPESDRTVVYLPHYENLRRSPDVTVTGAKTNIEDLLSTKTLLKRPSVHSSSPLNLGRGLKSSFPAQGERESLMISGPSLQMVAETVSVSADLLSTALANAKVTDNPKLGSIEAFKVKAKPFGHNAPLKQIYDEKGLNVGQEEWPIDEGEELGLQINWGSLRGMMQPPFQAAVSFKRNSEVLSASTELSEGDNPLKELDANINFKVIQDPDSPGKIIMIFTKNSAIPKKEVIMEFGTNAQHPNVTVTITPGLGQDKTTVTLFANQTWRRYVDGRRIEIAFPQGGISISDQSFGVPEPDIVYMDAQYDKIIPGSTILIHRTTKDNVKTLLVRKVKSVDTVSKTDYGISGTITKLTLGRPWLSDNDRLITVFRNATVYAQSEKLDILPAPLEEPVCNNDIELDGYVRGLKPGQWVIVSGERTDIPSTNNVLDSELTMLSGVSHDVHKTEKGEELPGDKYHTFLRLENDLSYCYKRDTVTIYGNVVKATHGETHRETLGSGDASKADQQFALHQSPLTMTSAPTKSGIESTLKVRVNDLLWHEAESLVDLKDSDRGYITFTDDDDKVTVVFGDGKNGLRPPTGVENIRADYRTGIGAPGNVKAGQISQLTSRPLGVKAVTNPKPSSGGADRESRDQARRNAPTALMALDRLVSVKDYADFARTFAGVAKASSVKMSDGRRQVVHITVAGEGDIPIDETSDLYLNLRLALHKFGDPYQPLKVALRDLIMLVISAKVRVLPDYQWESVEPKVRAALLDAFSFEKRSLGQNAYPGEVMSIIQSVKGVDFVDVDVFGGIPEKVLDEETKEYLPLTPGQIGDRINLIVNECEAQGPCKKVEASLAKPIARINRTTEIRPAQMAYLKPSLEDTLILAELKR